jgi:hypothetical protein
MEVTKPGNIHIETQSEDGKIQVLLSNDWAELYQKIYNNIIKTGLVSLELDFLQELADRYIGFLSVDFGPVSVNLGLLSLALYTILGKVIVKGYEIARTPAVYGKAIYGRFSYSKGGYAIAPVDLD